MATISFSTIFNLSTTPKKFQFTDTSDYAGQSIALTDVNGCFTIVAPSGITIYNNTDFDDADCDIFIDDALTNQTTIQLPLASDGFPEVGVYTITYTVYNSDTEEYYTVENSYTYEYVQPEISITQTVDCLSPLFTSTDTTDYDVDGITPTIDGEHTVYLPAAADVSPETEEFDSAGSVITLGFAEFYNGTQTTVITATLTYVFDDDLTVIDEITGSEEILVDCTDTCAIYCCLRTTEQLMIDYKTSNQTKYQEYTQLFSQIMSIAGLAQLAIRCGKSTDISTYLTEIKALAHCTDDCSCTDGDASPVTGLGGLINDVVVESGDATVVVTPVTVGNTTTYTITLDETFVNTVNNSYNTVVAAGTNVTVGDSGIVGGVRTFTVNAASLVSNGESSTINEAITVTTYTNVTGATFSGLSAGTYLVWFECNVISTDSASVFFRLYKDGVAADLEYEFVVANADQNTTSVSIFAKLTSVTSAFNVKAKYTGLASHTIKNQSLQYLKIA